VSRVLARRLPVLAGVAVLLAIWIIGGRQGWANGMVVTPMEAIRPLRVERSREVYLRATGSTAGAAARGLLIGSVVAVLGAIVASLLPSVRRGVTRFAALSNATPWVVVGPCMLIVLGRDRGPAGLAAIAAVFPVFVSTYVGFHSAPSAGLDVVRSLGGSRWCELRTLRIPAALPAFVDGLRLAAPAALAGAVFGEWYGAPRGIGVLLVAAMQGARPERLWAASLIAAVLAGACYAVLGLASRLMAKRFGHSAAPLAVPRSRHHGTRRALAEALGIVAFGSVVIGAWWSWIHLADVSPLVVPSPGRVFDDLFGHPGTYLAATGHTLATAAIALLIGTAFALAAAAMAGWSSFLASLSVPVVVALAATPLIALFPLLARVLGYGPGTVRALAALMVFFPVFVHARAGLLGTPQGPIDVLDSHGASRWSRFATLVVPAAVPRIGTGIRLAVGSSVVAAVVGESLIGRNGLGVEFTYAYNLLDLPRAFGAALVIVVVSLAVFAAATVAESAVHARWA
jgi:sulfonate transport system permease protein